jgi:hypothetical protein
VGWQVAHLSQRAQNGRQHRLVCSALVDERRTRYWRAAVLHWRQEGPRRPIQADKPHHLGKVLNTGPTKARLSNEPRRSLEVRKPPATDLRVVIGQRVPHDGLDIVDLDTVPPDQVLQGVMRRFARQVGAHLEVHGQGISNSSIFRSTELSRRGITYRLEVGLDRLVQLLVLLLTQQLSGQLLARFTEQAL